MKLCSPTRGAKALELIERTIVTDVVFGAAGERARVSAKNSDGRPRVFAPRLVLDASGRDTFLATRLQLIMANKRNSTAAVFAHFRKVEHNIGNMAGDITIHLVRDGWFWMIPLPGGIMSVGFVGNQNGFKNRRGSVQEFFFEKIRDSPTVSARMTLAELASEVTTTGNYSYCARSACGEGYFMIGDAFAFIDPVFSSGVLLAMTAGEIGAEVAIRWLEDPKAGLAMARKAERRMRNSMNKIGWFIYRINHPVFRDMFMAPSDRFRMRAGLVSILAGNVQSEWRYFGAFGRVQVYVLRIVGSLIVFGFRLSRFDKPDFRGVNPRDRTFRLMSFDPASGERRLSARFVQESRFGVWFLGTGIWANHVLKRAIEDLDRLIQNRRSSYPVIVGFWLRIRTLVQDAQRSLPARSNRGHRFRPGDARAIAPGG